MLWPHARSRRPGNVALHNQVAQARRDHPESAAWLGLLEAALDESQPGAGWDAGVPKPAADRPIKAPLLAQAEIGVDARLARRWVHRLLKLAERTDGRRLDAVALLEASVDQDDARIDALATSGGADARALAVVGQMAAIPLLQACARGLAADIPPTWWEGYCPLCGAWPALAEYVGLERKRQLRCGRCGTAWVIPLLRCVFCDETDHDQLGYLVPEGGEPTRKVEVCRTCKGYLKGQTTVRALEPWAILLDDLKSAPLDLAALERGYERPARPRYPLAARVVERTLPRWTLPFGARSKST